MATATHRGQILMETLWTLIVLISVVAFLVRLHHAVREEQRRVRWELQRSPK